MVIAKGSLSWFIASAGSNPHRTMITSGCAQYLVSVQRIVTLEFDAKQATYNSYLFLEENLLSRIFCRTCTCESAVAYWLAGRTLDRKIGELVVQGLVRLNLRTKTPCTVKIRSTVKGLFYKKPSCDTVCSLISTQKRKSLHSGHRLSPFSRTNDTV